MYRRDLKPGDIFKYLDEESGDTKSWYYVGPGYTGVTPRVPEANGRQGICKRSGAGPNNHRWNLEVRVWKSPGPVMNRWGEESP